MSAPTIRGTAITDVGLVRRQNEDAIAVAATTEFPLVRWNGTLSDTNGWALVADGIGGHAAGKVASQLAVELLRPVLGSLSDEHGITLALNAAHGGLFDTMEQHPSFIGMGTTIAGVLIRKDHALAFNVGDSRIYLHHGGKLAQISVDHVTSGNLLTQCLGGFVRESRIEPHVTAVPLSPDAQLLLCSDGLTRVLTDEQIASSLGQGGQNAAERLVAAALQGGGHDNISVVLVEILSGS